MNKLHGHPIPGDASDSMQRWEPNVRRLAYARAESRADTGDVCQDVFLALPAHPPQLGTDEVLRAWLPRRTVNRCNNLGHRGLRHTTAPLHGIGCCAT